MRTKKFFLILVIAFSAVIYTYAQTDQISIGPRGGINISDVTNVEESQPEDGLVLGITSTYSFHHTYGLTVDLLYSVEGYKAPFEQYHLRYLQVPVLFNYFFGQQGNRFRPKIYAGLSPAFFLGGTLNDLDVNEVFFNNFIVHGVGGLGFNYRVGNRIWLNTDARYFRGLNDIRDGEYRTEESIQGRTLQFSLGLAYGLAKI